MLGVSVGENITNTKLKPYPWLWAQRNNSYNLLYLKTIKIIPNDKATLKYYVLPEILIASNTKALASAFIKEDPAALGWTDLISPDRPMPWVILAETKL